MRKNRKLRGLLNPHPAEILTEEFLEPMELSQTAPARDRGAPATDQ
jgi:plasmid maintenance system antidote protein VapI